MRDKLVGQKVSGRGFEVHTSGHPRKMEALLVTLKILEVVWSLSLPWGSAFSATGLHGLLWIPCACGQNGWGVLPGEPPQCDLLILMLAWVASSFPFINEYSL